MSSNDSMKPPNVHGVSSEVIILTRSELENLRQQCFLAGVARGKFEARHNKSDISDIEISAGGDCYEIVDKDTIMISNIPYHSLAVSLAARLIKKVISLENAQREVDIANRIVK